MYPTVGEIDFHAVDIIHLFVPINFFDLPQNGVYIGRGSEFDAVFGDEVVRISGAQLARLAALVSQIAQEEGDAHKRIPAVVALGVDDAAVAFAADDGLRGLHLRGDVYFAHGRSRVLTAMLQGDVTQGTGGTEVRNGVARSLRQHVVGHAHQGVFLAKHRTRLADQSQTVYVGVDHDAQVVVSSGFHLVHDAREILLQRFGIMGEIAGRLAVEHFIFHAELRQELG